MTEFNKQNSISIIWHVDDVQMRLSIMEEYDWFKKKYGNNVELTHNECMKILSNIESYHDAEVGISWDTIENYINKYLEKKRTKEEIESFPFKPIPIPNSEKIKEA